MSVLIITSTVSVSSCLTVLLNPEIRLKQYVDSVLFYLSSKRINKIIVCDNSSFDYSQIKIISDHAVLNNKQIELLNFEGDVSKIQDSANSNYSWKNICMIIDKLIKNR